MTIGSTWYDTFHREAVLVNRVDDDILCVLKHSSKRSIFRVPIKRFKTHYKKLKV